VTAVLDSSYQALSPEAARAYRLLALCPGSDFSESAAAAVMGAGFISASRLAEELCGVSLLADTGEGRYRFHDLARDHAREQAGQHDSPAEQAAAAARGIDYYLVESARADDQVMPSRLRHSAAYYRARLRPHPGRSVAAAMAWVDAELPNVLAAQQAAADAGLHATAWQFADTLWGWILHRHDYRVWVRVCQVALASAEVCGDPRAQCMTRIRLAFYHRSQGSYEEAREHADRAMQISRITGNRDVEASSCEHVGLNDMEQRRYDEAIPYFERGLAIYAQLSGHPRGEAILHINLGRSCAALGASSRPTSTSKPPWPPSVISRILTTAPGRSPTSAKPASLRGMRAARSWPSMRPCR
jgi:tetratricopeptide (TPR) repeat protein